ncbi:unnamed protein product [Schistosoma mattheei]|uniref:Uncharacterized protein n=1 Tax=Schistosoma mattheei TaxID=31246 RepID=A0A183Q8M6_9TREM|nr:unnamed protein product [Schistosoma mattheei]
MKQLAGPYQLDEALLKQMWFQRLPHNVRQILSVSWKSVALDDLADMADKLMDVYHDIHHVNSVQPPGAVDTSCLTSFQMQLTQLTSQLEALQTTIATVQAIQQRSSYRRRSLSRQRSRSPRQTSKFCWCHNKYGDKARRCTRLCTFLQLIRLIRETAQPDSDGGACFWPLSKAFNSHQGSNFWLRIFSR